MSLDKQDSGWTEISSDHLSHVKYDETESKLAVRFQNGFEYHVHGVSPKDYREFISAPSQGIHYHRVLKNNFHVERVK